jgi:Mg/Co/Ni transporter MgtE
MLHPDENTRLTENSIDHFSEMEMPDGGCSQADIMITELKLQIDTLKARIYRLESEEKSDTENLSFYSSLLDRGGWLIGLLFFQSCSSFILSANQELIKDHPAIIYFLTMLVGAGGNAGNQAAVRVIRGLAVGTLNVKTRRAFFNRELKMAIALSFILGVFGFIRGMMSSTKLAESIVVTIALMCIVLISIISGALLPLLLQLCKFDPAHSSTSIQVRIMLTYKSSTITMDYILGDNGYTWCINNMLGSKYVA